MRPNQLAAAFVLLFIAVLLASMAWATPDGVTITPISNSTKTPEAGGLINTTGGSITTINLNGTTQNVRWKAFVGNVSGKLTLDDSAGSTIYDWTLTTITGEVYATRHSDTINWSGINCAGLNATEMENINLSHTSNVDDNITATFNGIDNKEMFVGTMRISASTCRTTNLFQNSTDQSGITDDFEEIVLHDKGNRSLNISNTIDFGKVVYAQTLEQNAFGYNNQTFDFQMIVPERGEATWSSSTAYYFYIELS